MSEEKERLRQVLIKNSILRGNFLLSSGKESNYYIDARMTTLDPEGVYLIGKIFLNLIMKNPDIQAVGGPSIGADPIVASIISQSYQSGYSLRGFIVRKEGKRHGTQKLIEGNLFKGDKVAIVEDVATTGDSIMRAITAVTDAGASVKKVLVIVDRDEGAKIRIEEMGYNFFSIFKIAELI